MNDWHEGRVYTASIAFTATTNPTEVLTLLASSLSRVELINLEIGLASSVASAGGVGVVELYRGTSASTGGSTGAAVTPANKDGWIGAPASTSVVTGNSTTLNSTANTSRLFAGTFDAAARKFCWKPDPSPNLDIMQRFHARVTQVTTAEFGSMAATLTYREGGKVPL